MNIITWFWVLLAGHCLSDTSLQTNAMGGGKNRNKGIDYTRVPAGQKPLNLWYMWLTHHSCIHGLVVYLLTQNVYLGMIETLSHWIIDFFKCENKYGPHIDQMLHLLFKLGYAIYLTVGVR